MFRLRTPIRCAHRHASLNMTEGVVLGARGVAISRFGNRGNHSQNGNRGRIILRRGFHLATGVCHSKNSGRNRRGPCGPRFYLGGHFLNRGPHRSKIAKSGAVIFRVIP